MEEEYNINYIDIALIIIVGFIIMCLSVGILKYNDTSNIQIDRTHQTDIRR